jgi:preprotein translocase subunit SecA
VQTDCERAVIVFFSNDVILKEFKESAHFSPYDGSKADTLTEKNDNDEKTSKVSNATNQGHVTLLTREFGRGTDFKYQGDLVINAGGLLVIQTFFTNDYSEEIQIRGRTRRQGTTGSYELIVQLEDLYTCLEKEQVSGILSANQSPEARYKALHSKRQELFEKA